SWISPRTWRRTSSVSRSCREQPAQTLDSRRQRRQAMKSTIEILLALLLLGGCAKKKDLSGALHAGDLLVQLQLDPDPPRAGDNVLRLELMDAQGRPIDG